LAVRIGRLGHSDARITIGTYSHAEEADGRRVADAMGRILDSVGLTNEKPLVLESLQMTEVN
ncbi:MAG TPA: hypothetical protein VNJ12_12890, partial [Candidatus Dormibacteraeota bacterium]|nr:hypothetical protein [Candidatus Dormibacteraeota bacterium]